ncbi:MAG: site-specific integrase [Solirubrobacteraceae bacterium]
MSSIEGTGRRSYGTGSLEVRQDGRGREVWYGRWHANGRRVKRRIGPKRTPGERDGFTRAQAEAALRRLMAAEAQPEVAAARSLTVAELGESYQQHLERLGRKRTTLASVESVRRIWFDPILGDRQASAICVQDMEDLMRTMRKTGVGSKTIRNYIGTLSAMYRYARHPRRAWLPMNPCEALELPPADAHAEIRFLTLVEVEAVVSAAVEGDYHDLDRALYLTAATTGLRQGELIALQWSDVDWSAQRIRVRRNHVLGEFDTPKSRRGSRSVPMTRRLAGELDRLAQASRWTEDDDLVFGDPHTGLPLARGRLMRRYRQALVAAQLDPTTRFHDYADVFVMPTLLRRSCSGRFWGRCRRHN